MSTFSATLNNRNFRLFFLGQGLSNIGNLMKQVAIGWLVYRLTDSAIILGVVMFSRELAAFVISPFAGVIADRLNKYRLLILANCLLMANATLLGLLTVYEHINVFWMIGVQLIFGCISGVEIPTRQVFINDLVEHKENLSNAIALNSTLFNTARILGPSVAGILIPIVGEGYCFLIYAFMLVMIVLIFNFIDYSPRQVTRVRKRFYQEMGEGIKYAYQSKPIRLILILVSVVTCFGLSYEVLLPIFADRVFNANSTVFGYMTSAIGAGSIVGAVFIASRKNLSGMEKILGVGVAIFGLCILLFSQITQLGIALFILFVAGTGRVLVFTANNTLLQSIAEDDKRGRVLSLYIMIFMGSKTIGNLLMGILADYLGVASATTLGALTCILAVLVLYPNFYLIKNQIDEIQKASQPAVQTPEAM